MSALFNCFRLSNVCVAVSVFSNGETHARRPWAIRKQAALHCRAGRAAELMMTDALLPAPLRACRHQRLLL